MRRWLVAIAILIAAGFALFFLRTSRQAAREEQVESPAIAPPQAPGITSTSKAPTAPVTQAVQVPAPEAPGNIPTPQTIAPSAPTVAPVSGGANVSSIVTQDLPTLPVNTLLENARTAIRDYGSMFNGNPVGNNAEITRALNGDNPKQAKLISPDSGLKVNGKGELIDPWGTPLFFHQLSADETEIRSAGPDKVLWTSDDIVVK